MHTSFRWLTGCLALLFGLLAVPTLRGADPDSLPRFTEEREAAALFFVKKHLPELVPFLEVLKKDNQTMYNQQVREIFHLSEMLADLRDEPRLYDLELSIWKTENITHLLIAKLSSCSDEERPALEKQLMEVARQLVDLDMQILEMKAEQLDRELGELRDELARLKDNPDGQAKERFDALLEKIRKRRNSK
ncbi:MAG: hypothetical protein AB7K24_15140 [Gemmataceae bacterium]